MRFEMVDDNSLDAFLSDENLTQNHSAPNAPHLRKIRKIKRPKIRPMADLPEAPKKVMPHAEKLSDEEIIAENVVSEIDAAQGTDLITAKEAQDLTFENQRETNPYVRETLPPELDYDDDEEYDGDDFDAVGGDDSRRAKKKLILFSIFAFLIGMFFQALFFAPETEEKHGLEGVVLNQDVPAGRPRCGLTERTQACVFYLMNCYKQELTGRDFYKLAAQLTGREEYMIETENLRYATVKIRPGHFAQINIPALK